MPTSSKKSATKKVTTKKKVSAKKQPKLTFWQRQRARLSTYLEGRTHRSFRRTRRRDYVRPLPIPGVLLSTYQVNALFFKYRKPFLLLGLIYVVLYVVLVGAASQDTYNEIVTALQAEDARTWTEAFGFVGQAGLVLLSIGGTIGGSFNEAQQIFSVILILLVWLTVVWMLRNLQAGHAVKLRDALYNAGAPIVSSFLVVLVLVIQLIPVGIAMFAYSMADASGLLTGGVEAMLFWTAAIILGMLSLYWITSTLFALIVVTLPGMYPMKALKIASELMFGRRINMLLRWVWMALFAFFAWIVVLLPVVMLDMWLKSLLPQLSWVPIVPFAIVCMGALTTMWVAIYVYTLYRKVVDYGTGQ